MYMLGLWQTRSGNIKTKTPLYKGGLRNGRIQLRHTQHGNTSDDQSSNTTRSSRHV